VDSSTDRTGNCAHTGSPGDRPRRPEGVIVPFSGRRAAVPVLPPSGGFVIDCADCTHRHTAVCDDCVVSFVVGRQADHALVVDADEARAVRLLERAGLVPGVRHEARASGR
jgi:hypothetical protein